MWVDKYKETGLWYWIASIIINFQDSAFVNNDENMNYKITLNLTAES